jgi:hypothetical protein
VARPDQLLQDALFALADAVDASPGALAEADDFVAAVRAARALDPNLAFRLRKRDAANA